MSGAVDEDVFQRGLADAEGLNFAGKGFDDVGDKAMAVLDFEADLLVHDGGIDMEFAANLSCQRLWIAGFQEDYIAADFSGERFGCAESDEVALVQDGEAIAALGFFHEMGSDDDGDALLVAEDSEVLPEVAAGAGIETGGRFIEEQDLGMVEQTFREFDAALHSAGEGFNVIVGTVEQSYAGENLVDTIFEVGATEAVEMSLMPQVFAGGEFGIDALGLKDDADVAAEGSGLVNGVEAGDGCAARSGDHQCGQNPEKRGLAAAVRTKQTEKLGGQDIKRNTIERAAVGVTVNQVADLNDGGS